METITCPRCGTENSSEAMNCKQCRINLKFALENSETSSDLNQREQELSTTAVAQSPSKAGTVITGIFVGILGAIIGAVPIQALKYFLADLLIGIFGSYSATPVSLFLLIYGFPLPFSMALICVPLGGALFGMIGASIAFIRHSPRVWLWSGVAGFLSNLLVGFMSQ